MFGIQISNFASTLSGLRSFVDLVHPFLVEKKHETIQKRGDDLAPLMIAIAEMNPSLKSKLSGPIEELRQRYGGLLKIEK